MVIYRTIAGSRLYGYHNNDSDYDYRGVYLFNSFEMFSTSTPKDVITIGSAANDLVDYELRKFCNLALKGNPNILEILFSTHKNRSMANAWTPFFENRHAFLSQRIKAAYYGFMFSEVRKLKKNYDTKAAANAWRLGMQALEILQTGTFNPTLREDQQSYMRAVREGKETSDSLLDVLEKLVLQLDSVETRLPEHPNTTLVNALCITTYRNYLYDH